MNKNIPEPRPGQDDYDRIHCGEPFTKHSQEAWRLRNVLRGCARSAFEFVEYR